jgi:glycosyltransferase involved in cell wall biosynthesis
MKDRRSIHFVINEDWFFLSHFRIMAETARDLGLDVTIMANVGEAKAKLEAEGWSVMPLASRRGSLSILQALRNVLEVKRTIRRERPALVHAISLPSVLTGGIGAVLAGAPALILAPTGLGHLWIEPDPVTKVLRSGVRLALAALFRAPGVTTLFENADDPRVFGLDPADERKVVLVGGAGVDTDAFAPAQDAFDPSTEGPLRCAVVSRMTYPKGIDTAVEAVRLARGRGVAVTLELVGAPDARNRRSLDEATLRQWSGEPGIAWTGPSSDVGSVWRAHEVAILLSKREGLPRSLVEAMACGRPVIATDVPGCRELVRDGVDGFLTPVGDHAAVADALQRLASDPGLRTRMGRAARDRIVERFSTPAVRQVMAGLYARLLARTGG